MMIADYASPDYGFLQSPDKTENAHEGYFMSEDILRQASVVMDLLSKHYPNDDHVFVYDNATTHLK